MNDWRIIYPKVPGKLKKLIVVSYKLLLISATVSVSSAEICCYRIPRPGIWEWRKASGNSGVRVAWEEIFYCKAGGGVERRGED